MLMIVICTHAKVPFNPKSTQFPSRLSLSPPIAHLLALAIILHESVFPTQTLELLLRILLCAVFDVRVGYSSLAKRGNQHTVSRRARVVLHTLYPEALLEMSSVVPLMLSMGLD